MGSTVVCVSKDKLLHGLLTEGKQYIAIATTGLGDLKIKHDDNGNENYYKKEYFEVNYKELGELPYIKWW